MSQQAYGILAKIAEVDRALRENKSLASRVFEVHPELSFAEWNGGNALGFAKRSANGKMERRQLIEKRWPGVIESLRKSLSGGQYGIDDLHDALAALWSIERVAANKHVELGSGAIDSFGLPMRIVG
jgi:predicted RNase H-like nuclease